MSVEQHEIDSRFVRFDSHNPDDEKCIETGFFLPVVLFYVRCALSPGIVGGVSNRRRCHNKFSPKKAFSTIFPLVRFDFGACFRARDAIQWDHWKIYYLNFLVFFDCHFVTEYFRLMHGIVKWTGQWCMSYQSFNYHMANGCLSNSIFVLYQCINVLFVSRKIWWNERNGSERKPTKGPTKCAHSAIRWTENIDDKKTKCRIKKWT